MGLSRDSTCHSSQSLAPIAFASRPSFRIAGRFPLWYAPCVHGTAAKTTLKAHVSLSFHRAPGFACAGSRPDHPRDLLAEPGRTVGLLDAARLQYRRRPPRRTHRSVAPFPVAARARRRAHPAHSVGTARRRRLRPRIAPLLARGNRNLAARVATSVDLARSPRCARSADGARRRLSGRVPLLRPSRLGIPLAHPAAAHHRSRERARAAHEAPGPFRG